MRFQYLYMSYMPLTLYTSRAKESDTDIRFLESLLTKTYGKILAYLRVFGLVSPKLRKERILMRDRRLLLAFLVHLHKTGALSVPPEDLTEAVEVVAEEFSIAEGLQEMLAALVPIQEEKRAKD